MYIEIISTLSTILAVIGVLLNNRLNHYCFYIWLISNSLCAFVHIDARLWSLAVRDVIFIGLAYEGLYRWTSHPKSNRSGRH